MSIKKYTILFLILAVITLHKEQTLTQSCFIDPDMEITNGEHIIYFATYNLKTFVIMCAHFHVTLCRYFSFD